MVQNQLIAWNHLVNDAGIELRDDDFSEDQDCQGCSTGIEQFADVVESRVSNHAEIGAIGQKHQEIHPQHDEHPIPSHPQIGLSEDVVVNEEHGDGVGDKEDDGIEHQHPIARQGVVGLLAEKEVANLEQDKSHHSL